LPAPDGDLALLEEAIREGGAIARSFFGGQYKRWDKGKGQPVTEADLAVDRHLRDTLSAARPDYGWLSEESEDDSARRTAARTFIVDPIDGTIAFLKGRPHFTICAAVVEGGVPVAGAIYNPITGECFAAEQGAGATLNGAPIRVSGRDALEGCRMLSSKSVLEHPEWANPWPPMAIESRSSIAYRMALVASGTFDAALALSAKHDWDLAAGDVIVREAGGLVTDHRGHALRYNGAVPVLPSLVCAGPALHALLLDRVRDLDLSPPRGTP
jgi:myo-inositol-1(or 4)-monophosphatase